MSELRGILITWETETQQTLDTLPLCGRLESTAGTTDFGPKVFNITWPDFPHVRLKFIHVKRSFNEIPFFSPWLTDKLNTVLIFRALNLKVVGVSAHSCPTFVIPWTAACQAALSMEFSRQEYMSGLPCPPLGDLPNPGIKLESPAFPALKVDFKNKQTNKNTEPLGK